MIAASVPNSAAIADKLENSIFDFEHVSCKGRENEVRVVVTDVAKSVGLISADLYPNKQEGFLMGPPARLAQVKYAAKSPVTSFCIVTPGDGEFAIALYHDENANGTLDKGSFGVPTEPWGISNNPKVRFAPPKVTEATFPVTKDGAALEIELN